jgi:hypothetical protein
MAGRYLDDLIEDEARPDGSAGGQNKQGEPPVNLIEDDGEMATAVSMGTG